MIELKSISAIIVAMIATIIAEEWFPYDCNNCWTYLFPVIDSDHMDQPLVSLGKFNVHLSVLLPLTIIYKLIKQIISKYRLQLFTLQAEVSWSPYVPAGE